MNDLLSWANSQLIKTEVAITQSNITKPKANNKNFKFIRKAK